MRLLIHLFDLITSDAITLAATGVLTLAVLALLVLIAWPSRQDGPAASARAPRSAAARALAASGTPTVEIARRTGLSRDALALLSGMAATSARQKAPTSAPPSVFKRLRRMGGAGALGGQVPA